MTEMWRTIPSAPDYEVSDLGRVRSQLPATKDRLRRICISGAGASSGQPGYPALSLQIGEPGSRRSVQRFVHHLVAEAFLGPRPDGMEIRHLDGNAHNSILSNLAYGTRSENVRDAVQHGTHVNTRRTHCKHGHEFTPENTGVRSNGTRVCRACKRRRRRVERRRAAQWAAAKKAELKGMAS